MLEIQSQVSLQCHNTLALPSVAEHFCRVTSLPSLQEALAWGRQHRHTVTVLGGGSNVVLTHNLPGLVVQMAIPGIELLSSTGHQRKIRIGAGENWHQLVINSLDQGWFGLENLSLIPGLAGAAPIQNIGAYGVELSERMLSLEVVELATGELGEMSRSDCQFGYRHSVFKGASRDRFAITSITLELSSEPDLRLEYPALQQMIEQNNVSVMTPQKVAEYVCAIRQSKLPDPAVTPNAGSFFKNPIVTEDTVRQLKSQYPKLVVYPLDEQSYKLAAGWLIEQAGWKGYEVDSVGVHPKQALVLVNKGGTGEALMALADRIQASVQEKFGVTLEIEPRVYS